MRRTLGTETSKYQQEKKSIEIPRVVASEIGEALLHQSIIVKWNTLGSVAVVGDSPVHEWLLLRVTTSKAGHETSCLNMGGPSSKAKYSLLTDSEPVP
jgi:hypothetical protein